MKHKPSKRSSSNKHPHPSRSTQLATRRLSTPGHTAPPISTEPSDTGLLESDSPCLKPTTSLKSYKLLKRELLRCSNQRPSLLGSQTLQPFRVHHGSQQFASLTSLSLDEEHRRSLTIHSQPLPISTDLIGPWPDISIARPRPDENDSSRPLKALRQTKHSHGYSPKYHTSLRDKTNQFQFYSSTRTCIDDYRQQKGYRLNIRPARPRAALSVSSSLLLVQSDDDLLSLTGTLSSGPTTTESSIGERTDLLARDSPPFSSPVRPTRKSLPEFVDHSKSRPIQPTLNMFPAIPTRHGVMRSTRPTQHLSSIALPTLTNPSLQYINSMNSVEAAYGESKPSPAPNASNLFFLDGRQKKR